MKKLILILPIILVGCQRVVINNEMNAFQASCGESIISYSRQDTEDKKTFTLSCKIK